jgi:cyclopropane-fatty-acyl-phospholipid synthase
LDQGQEVDLIIMARRMGLTPGMKALHIGFGFGVNTKYLAENFGIEVPGINISVEQKSYAEKVCGHLGDKVNFILADSCDISKTDKLKGKFDKVLHIEAIESIGGRKNFIPFFQFIADCLIPDGTCFGQVINTKDPVYATNPLIDKYLFPNGVLPKIGWMIDAMEHAGLHSRLADKTLDWANGRTCKAWWENFDKTGRRSKRCLTRN